MGDDLPLNAYGADLHIHTLLSPCAELEMIPSLIIEMALMAGLDIIGIADHNSCENAAAVMEAGAGSAVKVLPGLEVQSVEGVHFLCLFDALDAGAAIAGVGLCESSGDGGSAEALRASNGG